MKKLPTFTSVETVIFIESMENVLIKNSNTQQYYHKSVLKITSNILHCIVSQHITSKTKSAIL